MSASTIDPRYPIGKYQPAEYSKNQFEKWVNDLRVLPLSIENALLNLDEHQLDTPYREGGWTIRQLVHHVADSHMNAYIRFKWTLTEDHPTIKTYDEKSWARLKDGLTLPTNISVTLLHALHTRWVELVSSLDQEQLQRKFFHPEQKKDISLWDLLGTYAWHSRHHVAHILVARENKGWE